MRRFDQTCQLWIDHAEAAIARGELAEAVRRWGYALTRFPLDPACYDLGARLLARAGEMDSPNYCNDGRLRGLVRRCLGPVLDGESGMDREEFLDALKTIDLVPAVREALAVLTAGDATASACAQGIHLLCSAELGATARAMRDILQVRRGWKADPSFRALETRIAATQGFTPGAVALLEDIKQQHPTHVHAYRLQAEMLVWLGDYAAALDVFRTAPLVEAPPANAEHVFRGLELAIYLAAGEGKPVFADPVPGPALEDVVVVMMIRDEADIIGQHLRHHYRLGVRKFVILLNCCADDTVAIVERFGADHPQAILCTMVDPVEGYYQSDKTQAAIGFARAYFDAIRRPAKWCFVLDADEFVAIDGGLGLGGLIARAEQADADFITFHLCNAVPASGDAYCGDRDIYGFFDVVVGCAVPVVTKNAFRLDISAEIGMGNHSLVYPDITMQRGFVAAGAGARFVHLPYRSRAQLKTKIVNGGRAYEATTLDPGWGAHWRLQYQEYLEEGDAMLARRLALFQDSTLLEASARGAFFFR